MECNILQILSPRQQEIYALVCQGKSYNEISKTLNIAKGTIKAQWKRIKDKICELEKSDIEIIMDIFEEESSRSLQNNKTVKQMQFLSEKQNMHSANKRSKGMNWYYRTKTDYKKVTTRQMTNEERKNLFIQREELLPKNIIALEMYYHAFKNDLDASVEELARAELILRSYGCIRFTPNINKLNAKTSIALRAREEGYIATIFYPGEGKFLPQGSKFLESVKDGTGATEYSVWLVPK